ncbi:FecR domain-containing protein, partial [Staphylococcus aureus]|uniref:FecR family protein n=1 Tax=Staphylococcus aureus TaxID=1280 RepID=UPI0039BE90BE
ALRVAYDARTRHVRLDRGEAYFDVTHEPWRPFVVDTPSGRAEVLGTVFDVRQDADRTRVTVVEGHVAVSAPTGGSSVLGAGQSAWLGGAGLQAGSERDADPTAAWRHGQLDFFRTPLAEVMASLDRYRHGTIYLR